MNLQDLIHKLPILEGVGELNRDISNLNFDSRKIQPGGLYIAVKGVATDGHQFVDKALDAGAVAVVCETLPADLRDEVAYIKVKNSVKALGALASNFYGNPSEKITLVGITGTNGKTSATTLLSETFNLLGFKTALISTVEYRIGSKVYPSTHTTPDIISINRIMAEAVDSGCEYAFMEVSSHGIHQSRTEGLNFKIAGFTNITRDHLDYHKTFEDYLYTKKSFFDNLSPEAVAITNIDDKNGLVMLQNTKAKRRTYAMRTLADYSARCLEYSFEGMLLNFNGQEFWTALTGKFNVSNLLLVFAVASELGFEQVDILRAMSQLRRVNGRFEVITSATGIIFIVDYAHTPDALENILESINETRTKNERLICVFGCGGNRDHGKRPQMGSIATQKATLSILTSDNPRDEEPLQIIKDIEAGIAPQHFSKYTVIADRKEAIKMAIKFAEPKDIILVAGKGHETYQEIKGVRHHFDDREIITELLQLMGK